MTYTCRIGSLSALVLTLVLGACSTPDDLTAPSLEPQFGTAEDDIGTHVAFASTGRIYSLAKEFGYDYQENDEYGKVILKRFDGSGNLAWTSEVAASFCNEYYDDCQSITPKSLKANSQGFVFALYSTDLNGAGDCAYMVYNSVSKIDATGQTVTTFNLPDNGRSFGEDNSTMNASIAIAVDGNGNIYVAQQKGDFDENLCTVTRSNVVSKYSPTGSLLWQRTSTVGVPTDITVSSTGSIYVVGSAGIARYANSGGLTWKKTGNFEEVVISGSNIYTRYRKDIRKYDSSGNQLWLRTQSGLNTIVLQDMTGDGSGNVYLSGKYQASTGNFNPMVRKLNSSGSVLWTKTFGTSVYDDARGIATITGSEIYITGETQGSLAHTNIGGRDGYIRKFSSTGGTVWTR